MSELSVERKVKTYDVTATWWKYTTKSLTTSEPHGGCKITNIKNTHQHNSIHFFETSGTK